ncbi:hypothetical protein [Streptomyces cadmiisoli]|uniref:hypothetical protein n=1 Tax=Streptomyces cadmiisoli TaxID=2184053 RepID=UPI0036500E67
MLEISAIGDSFSLQRLAGVVEVLERARLEVMVEQSFWIATLPEWLLSEFNPERSREEKIAWLAQWRRAAPEEQNRLLEEQGWELMQWAYWFGCDNEEWAIRSISIDSENNVLKILLEGADEDSPVEAIDWLIGQSGCRTTEKRLI